MYTQYKLPYSYDSLEPYIDAQTIETHYAKHHAVYTKNLNDAVAKAGIEKNIESLLSSLWDISDNSLRQTLRNNGGGFYNHNLYFSTIGPDGGGEPSGAFASLLNDAFGSFSSFQEKLNELAVSRFGSGWAWLSANFDGRLRLSSSPNQDNPLMEDWGYVPILGIDVWEHAYYLKYKNVRANYIKAFYNIINWKSVADNYERIQDSKLT